MERRDFLKAAAGCAAAGLACGCTSPTSFAFWRKQGRGKAVSADGPELAAKGRSVPLAHPAPHRAPAPRPAPRGQGVQAISRNSWNAEAAIPSRLNPMGAVHNVTIHHEGSAKPNYSHALDDVIHDLRLIQKVHVRKMRAADIGYHYIVDRAGRIWQGRDVRYQGAHVRGHNPHNIGVMLLGNFEIQTPTAEQLASLEGLTRTLLRGYGLSASRLHFHKEFANTCCPGRNLAGRIVSLRDSLGPA
jgi:hypothetical protein